MSVIATAMRHLMAAGVSGEALLRAVAEIEQAQEKPSRSPAARRQSEYRQRQKGQEIAAEHVTGDVTDVTLRNGRKDDGPRPLRSIAHRNALAIWNEMAERNGLAKAITATGKRQAMLNERLKEHGADAFRRAVEAVERSPFLLGKNDRGWKADLGFLLRPDNFVKLLEGGYGPIENPKRAPRPPTARELQSMIAYAEDHDDPDRAAELRSQLAALTSADPRVAGAIASASSSLRVVSQ